MITAQPILFTRHPEEWQRIAAALGLIPPYPPSHGWAEFEGRGIFAIHATCEGRRGESVELNILVENLDQTEANLENAGYPVNRRMLSEGPVVDVSVSSGAKLTIASGARPATTGPLNIGTIWFQDDYEEPQAIFELLGLRETIASDRGTWHVFSADGGGIAQIHEGTAPRQDLSFEYDGEVNDLAFQLEEAGIEASVTDEAYGRALRIPTPGGGELWINQKQTDFYGYQNLES